MVIRSRIGSYELLWFSDSLISCSAIVNYAEETPGADLPKLSMDFLELEMQ